MTGVDFRPAARDLARAEFLQPGRFVMGLFLAVDPSATERFIERFGVGHGCLARALLGNAEPDTARAGVMFREPFSPIAGGFERNDRQTWFQPHGSVKYPKLR